MRVAIESVGCRLVYLPPYSPDLSPIEPMWSKLKQAIRSRDPRTVPALHKAIGESFATISAGAKAFALAISEPSAAAIHAASKGG